MSRPPRLLHVALCVLLLPACRGPRGSLQVEPLSIDFGEVDFQQEMPDGGYDPRVITLSNRGEQDLDVWLPGYDQERLCLEGFTAAEGVIELPTLSPGSPYLLTLSVCGYLSGERDLEVEGALRFLNDGEEPAVDLEYRFIPVRELGEDTGA